MGLLGSFVAELAGSSAPQPVAVPSREQASSAKLDATPPWGPAFRDEKNMTVATFLVTRPMLPQS